MRGLNQAVAVSAMCVQEESSVRPLMSDVVSALSFLGSDPDADTATAPVSHKPPPCDHQNMNMMDQNGYYQDEEKSQMERKRAVAEAIQWGCNSRHLATSM